VLDIDTGFAEAVDEGGAKRVAADLSDERHCAAEPGCGARLIGTFPSVEKRKIRASDRFARAREALYRRDDVHIGTADYDN
jgi:hypothetical protein